MYFAIEFTGLCKRQQCELDRSGEAARIGHAARRTDAVAVQLGQAVDEAVVLVAEILRQVDHREPCGHGVFGHPDRALAVGRAEEEAVDRAEVPLVAEAELRIALQSAVYRRQEVARVRGALHEAELDGGVVQQQAQQLRQQLKKLNLMLS